MSEIKSQIEVYRFLIREGWNVAKSTVYNHIRDGKLAPNRSGVFDPKVIRDHAKSQKSWKRADGSHLQTTETKAKAKAETRLKIAQAQRTELKYQKESGQVIPIERVESQFAARLRLFKRALEQFFDAEAPTIVRLVAGDQEKIPTLRAHLDRGLAEALDQYAGQGDIFEVPR